ncbi:MAG: hypothetical protein AB8B65_17785 [Kordia sp.]|uniref:hypothetical protein n=1 Tax=Kordia sp. TaxID=1965332 RepID=UPI003859F718
MKNNPIFKVLFAVFSIAFIAFTIVNWTSDIPTKEMYRNQIEMVQTFANEAQIPEYQLTYTSTPSEYLIDPFLIDSTLFFKIKTFEGEEFNSNRWEKIKRHLNYREDKFVKEIKVFLGDNDSGMELTKNSKILKNDTVHLEARYNFSKSGNLLLYTCFDSIVNFYDKYNRLRESVSYKPHSSEETLNQHKSYEYDSFGNLINYIEFHNNPKRQKYLFSYSTFEYAILNNKLQIKKTIYYQENGKDVSDKETFYYFFDEKKKLKQKTRIFSIASLGTKGKNLVQKYFYTYDSKGQLTDIIKDEKYTVHNTTYSWVRDDKNRLLIYEEQFNVGQTRYINKDSIIYHSPSERTEYHIETTNPKGKTSHKTGILNQNFYKEDAFRNTVFIKIVDESSPTNKEAWIYINKELKYLPNHTWYYMKEIQSYPYPSEELLEDMKENGFLKDDYSIWYREFNLQSTIPDSKFKYVADAKIEQMKRTFKEKYLTE